MLVLKIRIADVVEESIVDGEGVRYVIFTQGCKHHCKGCHNPDTHPLSGGVERDVDELLREIVSNPLIDGITLSGGEPFLQSSACLEIAKKARENNLSVWCFTGYTYDSVKEDPLMREIDVLVDGKFDVTQRSLTAPFRGSKNQRVIDVQESLLQDKVILKY